MGSCGEVQDVIKCEWRELSLFSFSQTSQFDLSAGDILAFTELGKRKEFEGKERGEKGKRNSSNQKHHV